MMTTADPLSVIKICGITNEEDARVALAAGANALGFNFYPKSPRYITPQQARELVNAVAEYSFLKVGVFVNASEEELQTAASDIPLDVLQLHGRNCVIPRGSYRVWRATTFSDPAMPEFGIEAYLIDSVTPLFGGSGKTFDWTLAKNFPHRAIIAGGLDASNVLEAIETTMPWGVDACSRLESRPGKKDSKRVDEFVNAALSASRKLVSNTTS